MFYGKGNVFQTLKIMVKYCLKIQNIKKKIKLKKKTEIVNE